MRYEYPKDPSDPEQMKQWEIDEAWAKHLYWIGCDCCYRFYPYDSTGKWKWTVKDYMNGVPMPSYGA